MWAFGFRYSNKGTLEKSAAAFNTAIEVATIALAPSFDLLEVPSEFD